MKTECKQMACLLKFLAESGNDVDHISRGWANMDEVYHMRRVLPSETKHHILKNFPLLKYWEFEGSPDLPADEGFFCKDHKLAVSFPRK